MKKQSWIMTGMSIFFILVLMGCVQKAPLLLPHNTFEPGTPLLWGSLKMDVGPSVKNPPQNIHFVFQNVQSGQKFMLAKQLKNQSSLIVFSLPEGKYKLIETVFFTTEQGNKYVHTIPWASLDQLYTVMPDRVAYLGNMLFSYHAVPNQPDKRYATIESTDQFKTDVREYNRYYGKNNLFAGSHISAYTGVPYSLLTKEIIQDLTTNTFYIPYRSEKNRIIVTPILNDKYKVEMVLDTGCNGTFLAPHVVTAMNIAVTDDLPISQSRIADGSTMESYRLVLDSIMLGGLKIKNLAVDTCKDCGQNFVNSLLCTDYLHLFNYQIDTQKELLILKIPD